MEYLVLKILAKVFRKHYFVRLNALNWPVGYINLKYLYKEIFVQASYKFDAGSTSIVASDSGHRNLVIIDCGANVGFSLIFFKRYYPNAKIICFEANPEIFAVLEQTKLKNEFEGVTLHNLALTSTGAESIPFHIGKAEQSLGSSLFKRNGLNTTVQVPATRLSDFINETIDFLKLDIEGAEYAVLDELLTSGKLSSIREGVIEVHKIDQHDPQALIEKLKQYFNVTIMSETKDAILLRFLNG